MFIVDRKDMSIFTLRFTKVLGFCFGTPVMMYVFLSTCDTPVQLLTCIEDINPYPTAFPYGNGMVLHFYQQQGSSTTKTVHKLLTRDVKRMYSRLTLVRISINL